MPQASLSDRKLVRELVLIVLIKLVLITALWWVFVREEKVPVVPDSIAARFAPPAAVKQQISIDGEHDGQ
ncbi:MAG: hypothetical protein RBT39_03985 [Azoarcus sp.]|jgi:hypothetical protein|nr:hypothetical protein [Azoarcus sp.]MDD2873158.1 hypothetical protein [Azoarcus sp.]MDX9836702.1 hypothetical protein [Azoarcus sp.]